MRYKECLDYIRSDYYRITGKKDVGIFRMWATTILDGGFHFLFWLRLSNCNNVILGGDSLIVLSDYWSYYAYFRTKTNKKWLWTENST